LLLGNGNLGAEVVTFREQARRGIGRTEIKHWRLGCIAVLFIASDRQRVWIIPNLILYLIHQILETRSIIYNFKSHERIDQKFELGIDFG